MSDFKPHDDLDVYIESLKEALLNFVMFFNTPQFALQFKNDEIFKAIMEQAKPLVINGN